MSLRSNILCPVFGHGQLFKPNVLPTYEDVLRCYLWISRNKHNQFKNLSTDSCAEVSTKLLEVWQRASIPTIERLSIIRKIKLYHDKYRNLLKPYNSRKNIDSYQNRMQIFKDQAQSLFDIAACKCENFDLCKCKKELKVPILERNFLTDQRTVRKMGIGSTDIKVSLKIEKQMQRKRKIQNLQKNKKRDESFSNYKTNSVELSSSSNDESCEYECPDEVHLKSVPLPSTESEPEPKKLKIHSMAAVANTADRYGISDRAAAAVVSATLQDVGLITKNNLSNVVDRNKIRRSRDIQRNILCNKLLLLQDTFGIYFDGRKDKTLTMVEYSRKIVLEEHISLLKEPDSEYIGHIAVANGKAKIVSNKIKEFLNEKNVDFDNLNVVGCDGTVVNTGVKNGVIRCLEETFNKPLQWFICQLHANELPLRHLFEHLDGCTAGPKSFTGPIGKILKHCETMPLVIFEPIICSLPNISNIKDLSTDQLYLYDICSAIKCGHCRESLRKKNPGNIVHSRWLTMANRILRLYISTLSPSENLLYLVNFILRVYAPMWFSIKTKPSCVNGAKHLHETIIRSRYLPDHLKAIIDPVIQRNGYFGHAENILLAMLADDRTEIKLLALRNILKCRESVSSVRIFKVPKLNFCAKYYNEIINWNELTITEPPILKKLGSDVLNECLQTPNKIDSLILPHMIKYPSHTQSTERCVKIVTEASAAVCGQTKRDGFIRARLESRKIMGTFHSKKDYKIA